MSRRAEPNQDNRTSNERDIRLSGSNVCVYTVEVTIIRRARPIRITEPVTTDMRLLRY